MTDAVISKNRILGRNAALLSAFVACAMACSASVHAADLIVKAPVETALEPSASTPNSYVIWMGSGVKGTGVGGGLGGVYALSGDLGASGWLVRSQATYVRYSFPTGLSPSGTANGSFADGNAAVGYQVVGSLFTASAFVGYDYQRIKTNPIAAGAPGAGVQSGAIFNGRLATEGDKVKFPLELDGSFSTAYNSYWVRGRSGVKLDRFTLGGELIGLGSNFFGEARTGGFVKYNISDHVGVEASAGYAYGTRGDASVRRGGNGAYIEAGLVFFH